LRFAIQNTTCMKTLLTVVLCVLTSLGGCHPRTPALIWTAVNVNSQSQQGDANLLRINNKTCILIDTGHLLYAEKLLRFLRDMNISCLNAVIISHGHRDHYGGLVFLLRNNIRVDAVYFNPPDAELIRQETWGCSVSEIKEIKKELSKRNIPLIAMTDKTRWDFGSGISMRVLYVYDGLNTPVGRTDINDTSAIIMLTHGKMKYLFTGDLNRPLGTYITKHNDVISLKADILKVPHHGTEGLSGNDFLAAVNPKAMVVPAPKDLWLSDRSKRVKDLSKDSPTYVNGLHGHIIIKSYGDSFRIETQSSPKAADISALILYGTPLWHILKDSISHEQEIPFTIRS